jgi:hypothetical protein
MRDPAQSGSSLRAVGSASLSDPMPIRHRSVAANFSMEHVPLWISLCLRAMDDSGLRTL